MTQPIDVFALKSGGFENARKRDEQNNKSNSWPIREQKYTKMYLQRCNKGAAQKEKISNSRGKKQKKTKIQQTFQNKNRKKQKKTKQTREEMNPELN